METNDCTRPAVLEDGTLQGGKIDPKYLPLWNVLMEAFEQASAGKGRERHVFNNAGFRDQQIFEIAEKVGIGFLSGQAVKKLYESTKQLVEHHKADAAKRDFLGAIVYTAAAVIITDEAKGALNAQHI